MTTRTEDRTAAKRRAHRVSWRDRIRAFARQTAGTSTIEFVIWIPIFLVILAFTADACKLYITQASMWNVARDTARRMAIGKLCTVAAAQTYAQQQMLYSNLTYSYTITMGANDDTVTISTPIKDASVFNVLSVYGSFAGNSLSASVTMPAEPGICA